MKEQFANHKEIKRLRQAHILHSLKTLRIHQTIAGCGNKNDLSLYVPDIQSHFILFLVGDWVQIPNTLRDEFETLGKIIKISQKFTFIYIKGVKTGTTFK